MEDKSILIMYSWLNNEYAPLNEEEQRELFRAKKGKREYHK